MDSNILQDKIVLITEAGRGIGRAIASTFAFVGTCVIVNYRRRETGIKRVVDELKKLNKRAVAIKGGSQQFKRC